MCNLQWPNIFECKKKLFKMAVKCATNSYSKCSKILNAFLLLFSNKMLIFSEDPDQKLLQTQSQSDLGLAGNQVFKNLGHSHFNHYAKPVRRHN